MALLPLIVFLEILFMLCLRLEFGRSNLPIWKKCEYNGSMEFFP